MRSIFFLDDSEEYLDVMKVFVQAACNFEAITCSNIESMQNQIEEILKSEMAFLDINLGLNQPSGIQAYRWLKSQGYNKPVFFLTGHAKDSDEAREAAIFEDARVLQKPIPPQDFRALIESTP
ncbi:MAG: response regulator [Pseudobdellovibrio sp.]|nr:response regulator [Pseudobdellovibrio sp.]